MAEAILYGVAKDIIMKLGSRPLNEVALAWGFKDQLDSLKNTINTIKDVLLDAEERQVDSYAVRGWLEKLTTTVYIADDLFDEFATVAEQKQLMVGNKVGKKVRTFFSSSNQIAYAFNISQKIKKIRQELDDIIKDSTQFAFVLRPHEDQERAMSTIRGRDQTYSFVLTEEVIGRDDDKNAILGMLLASSSTDDDHQHQDKDFPVVPIVGIGGLGKTTLAQLIYNDPQVEEFFELRLWVCVSDVFDIKTITEKILKSATNMKTHKLEMEQLQGRLRKEVSDKKYLLVLDDVWNENREKWLKLRALLNIGKKGSKILVTTRSRGVAETMGTFPPHDLQGLSDEKSWDLFEKLAFKPGQADQKPHLVNVGKEILKMCANVPLAIRTVGSLLYGKEERSWYLLKDTSIAKIPENQSDIMNILKLSYHHLWSPLKNCFAYCALFPKDYEYDIETLIDHWMAEGFIIPAASEGQNIEEVAQEYFFTLLQRGFFQDVRRDKKRDIMVCKMHDFMHDLAQEVAGVKYKVAGLDERNFDEKALHLSFAHRLTSSWKIPNGMLNLKLLRTFLLLVPKPDGSLFSKSIPQQLITSFSCLRVLDLRIFRLKSLPGSIGKLIHLRYLNLSKTPIEVLPDSITNLHNLQTLNLSFCSEFRALPPDIRKLINLRSLDIYGCWKLTHMPSGMGGLTSLNKLPKFIVNQRHSADLRYKSTISAKLSDLKELNHLKKKLDIDIYNNFDNLMEATQADLNSKQGLTEVSICFKGGHHIFDDYFDHDEVVLEGLKPHSNVKKLRIEGYKGQKLPSWTNMDNLCISLPNLVEIDLYKWNTCEQVPILSKLRFLKHLKISFMDNVEYIENVVCEDTISSSSHESQGMQNTFFPSLEKLELGFMENLKGWWNDAGGEKVDEKDAEDSSSYGFAKAMQQYNDHQFCNLTKLSIDGCPNLIMLPLCPNVEVLKITKISESLTLWKMVTTLTPSCSTTRLQLKELTLDNVEDQLMALPYQCLCDLSSLTVLWDWKLVSSLTRRAVFARLPSSLRFLTFNFCYNLTSISKGLEHLTSLQELILEHCEELDLLQEDEDEEGIMMPWKAFNNSLHSLRLCVLPKLVSLPSGLQHLVNLRRTKIFCNLELTELPEWISCLTSLQYMSLTDCPKLTSLPNGFRKLSSLIELKIYRCPGLTQRCRPPNGSEWPKIQHIFFFLF